MTIESVLLVKQELQRVAKAIEDYTTRYAEEGEILRLTGCKESGALRRASMDLTRALAHLRNS